MESPFQDHVTSPEWMAAVREGLYEALRIAERVRIECGISRGELVGRPASDFLAHVLSELEKRAAAEASRGYGRYRWLWYLRRLPADVFDGELATTGIYDRSLAEVLATRGAGHERSVGRPTSDGMFPIDGTVVKRIGWLFGFTKGVSQFHVNHRVAGKGGSLAFDYRAPGLPFPACRMRRLAPLEHEIAEFDQRVARQRIFSRSGIPIAPSDHSATHQANGLFLVSRITGPPLILVPPQLGLNQMAAMRYHPEFLPVDELREYLSHPLLGSAVPWSSELTPIISLLCLGAIAFARSPISRRNLLTAGYTILPRKDFDAYYEQARDDFRELQPLLTVFPEDLSGLALSDQLLPLEGQPFPLLSGPVAFTAPDEMIGIDLCNASERLADLLTFPRVDGDQARVRGQPFEKIVQREIDRTLWNPPDTVRDLIGHHFKKDGQMIGEVDAFGANDKTLLLVSCKSIIYTPEHDRGNFNVVKNARETIEKSVAQFARLERHFTDASVRPGEYDFSAYDRIVSIVTTPQAFFIQEPLLSETALPGLRRYSSFEEFREWLSGFSPA